MTDAIAWTPKESLLPLCHKKIPSWRTLWTWLHRTLLHHARRQEKKEAYLLHTRGIGVRESLAQAAHAVEMGPQWMCSVISDGGSTSCAELRARMLLERKHATSEAAHWKNVTSQAARCNKLRLV